MNKKKILNIACFIILTLAFSACTKKNPDAVVVEEPAIIGATNTPVYTGTDEKTILTKLKDGTKVICLNKQNPEPQPARPEEEATQTPEATLYYKIRIPESSQLGWVTTDSLGFKEDEETTAFVTTDTWLYGKLDSGTVQLHWGDTVTYLGYKIFHDWDKYSWEDMEMWRVDVGGVEGWMIAKFLLPDVFPAVILEDADLFKLPADRSQNIAGSVKKMDIVPVTDKGNDGWLTIRLPGESLDFFISAANGEPVSYKETDFSVVSYLRDAYYTGKPIVKEVNDAFKTMDSDAALAAIPGKVEKIESLQAAKDEIDERIPNYPDSSFSYELKELSSEMTEIIAILEDAVKPEIPEAEEGTDQGDNDETKLEPFDM